MSDDAGLDIFAAVNDAVAAAFGEPVGFDLIRAGQARVAGIAGVFDARHVAVDAGGEVPVADYQTTLSARRGDLGDVAAGDAVEVRGALYSIAELRPDSEGWVVLVLTEVAAAAERIT